MYRGVGKTFWLGGAQYVFVVQDIYIYRVGMEQTENLGGGGARAPGAPPPPGSYAYDVHERVCNNILQI